jgi:tRNA (uracil-5-)-methyltransferase TRM9
VKQSTSNALMALNRTLYADHAEAFSATRQKPWRGWDRLTAELPAAERFSVLDAGCGNGRFGVYLGGRRAIEYTGVDQSAALLAVARAALPDARLIEADLISWSADRTYDLVAAMGVLHHVPTMALRTALLQELARCCRRWLVFTFWSFDPAKAIDPRLVGIDPAELEPGDHVLRFGTHGFRYCHLADEAERAQLIQSTGLVLRDSWDDDDANRYVLFVR